MQHHKFAQPLPGVIISFFLYMCIFLIFKWRVIFQWVVKNLQLGIVDVLQLLENIQYILWGCSMFVRFKQPNLVQQLNIKLLYHITIQLLNIWGFVLTFIYKTRSCTLANLLNSIWSYKTEQTMPLGYYMSLWID